MAVPVDRKNPEGGKDRAGHDDDYFARQWEELQKAEKEREEAFRRRWLEWQKGAEQKAPYSPWLVVPAALTDFGQRPLTSGMPHWSSPFIGVYSPDPSGMPLAGAANTVWARVFNLGAATSAPTMLRYYWCDPSVGLGAADAHPIGEVMVEVKPMSSVVVPCPTPWIPAYLNNGHECLFVSADNAVFDPIQAPFKPWQDRHVGQRNVQVLPAVAQAMNLWLPGGFGFGFAELRVLALRVRMPGLPLKANPVATLAQVGDHVLSGFGALTRKSDTAGRLRFAAERISPEKVIAGIKLTGETRPVAERAGLEGVKIEAPDRFGERVLQFDQLPALNQQIALELRATDLGSHDFVLLHFAWLAGGHLLGGYAITLAHPGWFKAGPVQPPAGGGPMTPYENDQDLRDLVIRHNPQAAATYQIARQLEARLPLKSAKQLSDGIKLDDAYLPGGLIAQLGEALFPITTPNELVARVSAMLRMFVAYGNANRGSLNSETALLLDRLQGHGKRPAMQVLVAQGEPIFPLPPEEKEA